MFKQCYLGLFLTATGILVRADAPKLPGFSVAESHDHSKVYSAKYQVLDSVLPVSTAGLLIDADIQNGALRISRFDQLTGSISSNILSEITIEPKEETSISPDGHVLLKEIGGPLSFSGLSDVAYILGATPFSRDDIIAVACAMHTGATDYLLGVNVSSGNAVWKIPLDSNDIGATQLAWIGSDLLIAESHQGFNTRISVFNTKSGKRVLGNLFKDTDVRVIVSSNALAIFSLSKPSLKPIALLSF